MGNIIDRHSKVISIYSNTKIPGKTEYAINLSTSLARLIEHKVILIDIKDASLNALDMLKLGGEPKGGSIIRTQIGIDVLILQTFDRYLLEHLKNNYRYIIINIPVSANNIIYDIFSISDSIHLFLCSTKKSLNDARDFLDYIINKGPENAHEKLKIVINHLDLFDKFSIEEMSWLLKHDIWSILPEPKMLDVLIDAKGIPLILKSQNSPYSKSLSHIAKIETGKLLGLALGSGAAYGLAHIGALKVLEENNIKVDILSGSSIGALVACLWGLGFPSAKIEIIAKRLKNKLNIMSLLDFALLPMSGILEGKRLKRFLKNIIGEKTFEDLQIPVKIMVYDLANRETICIDQGSLVEAVYMSISVPGIFKPKIIDGKMLIDGGVSDPVPVDILHKHGAKKVIAVNVMPSPEDIYKRNILLKRLEEEEKNILADGPYLKKITILFKKYLRSVFNPNIFDIIMTSMQSIEYVLAENSCKKASLVLHPVVHEATSIDFHKAKKIIEMGEKETLSKLKEIKELVLK